ncbi:MAG: hypothetical protein M1168_03575 [Candidatus Marsarchaeota archaeon]|nr:hypothetical protein [Candidatus Marsarchaeota archaeon]MCL5095032.1 hypothetical protein [Candidatus Marsarchaeota archaeon]
MQIKLILNKTKISDMQLNLILNNRYQLNTSTNNSTLNIYMPLKLGQNVLEIETSKNSRAFVYFFYFTELINLLYIGISVICLLLIKFISDNKLRDEKIIIRIDEDNKVSGKTNKLIEISIKEAENIIKKITSVINREKIGHNLSINFNELKTEFCKIYNIEYNDLFDDEINYIIEKLKKENILADYHKFICLNKNISKQIICRLTYNKSLFENSFKIGKNILKINNFILLNNIKIKKIKKMINEGQVLRIVDFNSVTDTFKLIYNKNNAIFLFLELNNYIEVYKW